MLDHFVVLKDVADWSQGRAELVQGRLARVNLWKLRHQRLHGFSGGMRQRPGIAQALIGQTYPIIVDEPTAGLDPEERHRRLDLLATCGENAVVILATHLVEDVALFAHAWPVQFSTSANSRSLSAATIRLALVDAYV